MSWGDDMLDGMALAAIVREDRDLARAGPGCDPDLRGALHSRLRAFAQRSPAERPRELARLARRLRPAAGPLPQRVRDGGLHRYLVRLGAAGRSWPA